MTLRSSELGARPNVSNPWLVMVGLLGALLGGCAEAGPPEGTELVLEIGGLEVYRAFEGELCAGTLRRIELQVLGLSELFEMEPPRARVSMFADAEAVSAACDRPWPVWGCTGGWGAHALPVSATHELAHVFTRAATGRVQTRPMLEEGIADRLEGWRVEPPAGHVSDLETLLAIQSSHDLDRLSSSLFVAWAIDRIGLDAVLDAFVTTSAAESDEEVGLALATSLGFASLADLQAEFDATHADTYPPLPDTTAVFSAEDLAEGVLLDTSCGAALTEGPSNGELTTTARLEIREAGQYEVSYSPIPYEQFKPWMVPPDPVHGRDLGYELALDCSYEVPVPRFVFHGPGQYEFSVVHSVDESFQARLSVRRVPGDHCTSD